MIRRRGECHCVRCRRPMEIIAFIGENAVAWMCNRCGVWPSEGWDSYYQRFDALPHA